MKTIVTHHYPDVDAVSAIWLIKTFLNSWSEAAVAFVPAGSTLDGKDPDSDPDIIHVDTGLGQFDHHQQDELTCATKLVFEFLKRERKGHTAEERKNYHATVAHWNEEALERLVAVITEIDHFHQVFWPEPTHDRYDLSLEGAIDGWKLIAQGSGHDWDLEIVTRSMQMLDGIYHTLINKVWAIQELDSKKIEFVSPWGKGVAVKTLNDDVLTLALKSGYAVAIRQDEHKNYVRIKSRPGTAGDLSAVFSELKRRDPKASWFLHASRQMILNGSTKNPTMKATTLRLEEIIDILKKGEGGVQ